MPSNVLFMSPILIVLKLGSRLRFYIDYRKLNTLTKKDIYPIPLVDELLQRISKAKIFTKLDIRQGFHRIRIDPVSEDLTTFKTRYGSFKYKVLPFGLTNGPTSFQRFINSALNEYLDEFCVAFVDDVLIYSEDPLKQALRSSPILAHYNPEAPTQIETDALDGAVGVVLSRQKKGGEDQFWYLVAYFSKTMDIH